MDRRKGEVVSGERVPGEQLGLQRFLPRREVGAVQVGGEDDLDLADARDVVDGQEGVDLDVGAGLLLRFAPGAVHDRLAQFEVSGRDRPKALARFDCAAAQEDPVAHSDDGTDDDLGIIIGDMAAVGADQALAVVALGHLAPAGTDLGTLPDLRAAFPGLIGAGDGRFPLFAGHGRDDAALAHRRQARPHRRRADHEETDLSMGLKKRIATAIEEAEEHYRQGRLDDSAAAYDIVLSEDPDHLDALEWRGEIAVQQDDYDQAAEHLSRARALRGDDDFAEFTNLGLCYYELNRPDEAVETLWRAIERDAEDLVSHSNLGKALYDQHANGDTAEAIRIAGLWLQAFPDNPDAKHIGAAIGGGTVPDVANAAYVADVFDDYAETFDEKLAELGYRAPALLNELLGKHGIGAAEETGADLTVLDAGCGTGLFGALLRPLAARLEGVDLSPGMLKKAAAKKFYDDLAEAELVAYLAERPGRYDLIAAADVFCYFGALDDALAASRDALRPGGHLTFSVERIADASDTAPFVLNESGRYKHDPDHVKALLKAAGFKIRAHRRAVLRHEYGEPVAGLIVLARKDAQR